MKAEILALGHGFVDLLGRLVVVGEALRLGGQQQGLRRVAQQAPCPLGLALRLLRLAGGQRHQAAADRVVAGGAAALRLPAAKPAPQVQQPDQQAQHQVHRQHEPCQHGDGDRCRGFERDAGNGAADLPRQAGYPPGDRDHDGGDDDEEDGADHQERASAASAARASSSACACSRQPAMAFAAAGSSGSSAATAPARSPASSFACACASTRETG